MATERKSLISPFWAIVIVLLIVVGAVFFFTDIMRQDQVTDRDIEAPSTEWTTAPEDGVDVDLPDTPMRAEPDEETASEGGAE